MKILFALNPDFDRDFSFEMKPHILILLLQSGLIALSYMICVWW